MRIIISAIGRMGHTGPEYILMNDYIRKTRWPVTVAESVEKRSLTGEALKQAESKLLWSHVPAGAKVIVLDEKGQEPTSSELACKIGRWRDNGVQEVAFLIGGADGHTAETRARADMILSFGRMTMPHLLARVVLAEQIYRIKSILDGHPYHRE